LKKFQTFCRFCNRLLFSKAHRQKHFLVDSCLPSDKILAQIVEGCDPIKRRLRGGGGGGGGGGDDDDDDDDDDAGPCQKRSSLAGKPEVLAPNLAPSSLR
jgi:hypothetical protein